MSEPLPKGQERRNFYRLDDEVIFDFCVLGSEDCPSRLERDEPILGMQHIAKELREIDNTHQTALLNIGTKQPVVAEYLRAINQKIDLLTHFLTQELLAKFLLKADQRPTEKVNISAGGVAFAHSDPLELDTTIRCKIILKPTYDCILTDAKVVSCITQPDIAIGRPFRISIKFTGISAYDEQILARYVLQKQINQRRAEIEESDE